MDAHPIETAPKDEAILVYASGWTVAHFNTFYGKWIGYGEDTADTHNMNGFNKPTHWLPLPPAPETSD